jgi:hypothetical protein
MGRHICGAFNPFIPFRKSEPLNFENFGLNQGQVGRFKGGARFPAGPLPRAVFGRSQVAADPLGKR